MILVINLLGATKSKAHIAVPHGTVCATVLVTLLVFPSSQWSLLSQACCGPGCCLKHVSVNVPGLDSLLQRSLAWGWSCKGLWLRPTLSETPDSWPDPQRFLVPAYSL